MILNLFTDSKNCVLYVVNNDVLMEPKRLNPTLRAQCNTWTVFSTHTLELWCVVQLKLKCKWRGMHAYNITIVKCRHFLLSPFSIVSWIAEEKQDLFLYRNLNFPFNLVVYMDLRIISDFENSVNCFVI